MNKQTLLIAALTYIPAAMLTSCDDDDKEPEIPVMGSVSLRQTEYSPGDTIKANLQLKYQGKYVKVTYAYATSPSISNGGTFECGSSQDNKSFSIPIPEEADTLFKNTNIQDIKLTVTPIRITAYAGDQLYFEPQLMESTHTTFTLKKRE